MSKAFRLESTFVNLQPDDSAVPMKVGPRLPRGVWHRGVARKPGKLMFITPGAGIQHRPVGL